MSAPRHVLDDRSALVKRLAQSHGFMACGISQAGKLEAESRQLETWLNRGYHGKMGYMENHFEKRTDPTLLVSGAKSVVSLLFNYHNPDTPQDPDAPKVSQYAYGQDYHHVLRRKLHALKHDMEAAFGAIDGRVFVDSAPVLDKAWAVQAGLGWMGKHSNVLRKANGSYFFIAEIISDLELAPDGPVTDHCGSCTACIDACPTEAIVEPYLVDGSKCISYFTIELKDADLPTQLQGQFDNWAFGCDVCQQVCPWNRFAERHNEPAFEPHEKLMHLAAADWADLEWDLFQEIFKKTPVKRTGFEGLKRNIRFLNENTSGSSSGEGESVE